MKAKNLLLSMIAVLSLAGCSGNGGNTTSGSKEIVFWHCLGHDKTKNLEKIVEKFNADHKETDGYQVKLEQIAGAYDALHDAVKTKLQAGSVPSITMGYPDSFAEYIGSNGEGQSKILNLTDKISDTIRSSFVSEYYEEGTHYQYTGTWSVPLYKSTEVMYYNKTMYESSKFYKAHKDETYGSFGAKISDPSTWDWDTLVYVGKQIQEENNGVSDFHALGYDSDSNLFITQMEQRGIPYTTSEGTGYNHFKFVDSSGTINADLVSLTNEIYQLSAIDQVLVTQNSYGSYASNLFKQKKVMFTIGSTGGSSYNEPSGAFECGLAAVPTYHNNKKYIMQGPSLCFFNTKDTAKEAAAWEFYTNYVADATLNADLALENSYDPVLTASYDTDDYKRWTANGVTSDGKDNVEADLQYRIPNLTKTLKENYMTSPVFIGSSEARTQIGLLISTMKTNGGDATKAITSAYQNMVKAAGNN